MRQLKLERSTNSHKKEASEIRLHRRFFALLLVGGFLLIESSITLAYQLPMEPFILDHSEVVFIGFPEYITTGSMRNDTFSFHPVEGASGSFAVTVIGWEAGHGDVFIVDGASMSDNREERNFVSRVTVDLETQYATFEYTSNLLTGMAENAKLDLELWILDPDVTLAYLNDFFLHLPTAIAESNNNFADSNDDYMIGPYAGTPDPASMFLFHCGLIGWTDRPCSNLKEVFEKNQAIR